MVEQKLMQNSIAWSFPGFPARGFLARLFAALPPTALPRRSQGVICGLNRVSISGAVNTGKQEASIAVLN